MNKVLAIDIETGNSAADIGGWNNTHMWNITCVTTWDGKESKAYVEYQEGKSNLLQIMEQYRTPV